MSKPLYERAPTTRFTDRAKQYALGRPSYPHEAITEILRGFDDARVLDLGAGTGIATRLLGSRAIALEPNHSMAAVSGVTVVLAQSEAIPFRNGSFDIVTAFNSFHWMRPEIAFPEMRRVLRRDGRLALVWNGWDETDPATAAFVAILNAFAGDHPPENRALEVAPLYETTEFRDVVRHDFPYVHTLDRATLNMRVQSISYLPTEGEVMRHVDEWFERFERDGLVRHHYVTNLFLAQPSG